MNMATLPMYDFPALKGATDALWSGLAQAMRSEGFSHVPDRLDRSQPDHKLWLASNLLFGQTCGYPLTHQLKEKVQFVATPIYITPTGKSSYYWSVFLVRESDSASDLADMRGKRVVVNSKDSQSGYSALRHTLAPLTKGMIFFSEVLISGGHLTSMKWVQQLKADLCSIDVITYSLAKRVQPEIVEGLRILGQSERAPNLPYITRMGLSIENVKRLRNAVAATMAAGDLQSVRDDLLLAGIDCLPLSTYDCILEMEEEAKSYGYSQII